MHAVHKISGQEVAIKVIDKSKLDESSRKQIQVEATILYKFRHPNIVKVVEVF